MKKLIEWLESLPALIISGVFLVTSLILSLAGVEVAPCPDPAVITAIISGLPIITYAVTNIFSGKGIRKISSPLLISIAMIASIIIGDTFAAGEIAFIMAIGELLEEKTTARARKGLKKLIELTPQQGRRISENGGEVMIDASEIKIGDTLRVLPGEKLPVDGVIVRGQTTIDQSVMTGESIPVDKETGDEVFSGTVNCFGAVDIKATKVGEDSSIQKLIKMVQDAENRQAPTQRLADKWAAILVPAAMLIAVITGLLTQDIIAAVTILVVFCPCAMVLATPTAIMAAIGQAANNGVIIKSGEALEKMGKVNTIAFDKTGTITHGKLEICDVIPLNDRFTKEELLKLTASAESMSEHPLGKAITAYAKAQGIELVSPARFSMCAGKGICADIDDMTLYCGTEHYLSKNDITVNEQASAILCELRKTGKAAVIVAADNMVVGIIALSDTLRDNISDITKKLHENDVRTVLLTGDNAQTAEHFASLAGIDTVCAGLLPSEKVEHIIKLQEAQGKVCMVGDGINDAPALKAADVGIAMGAIGSDIALEASDIALMSDDISKLPYLKKLAKATLNTIRFSISLSLFINLVAIVLSIFQLLDPTTGALIHNVGSVFVVLIATLLYERKFDR